jgi:filamin
MKIDDIGKDFGDGVKLCHLLEIISSKSLGKFHQKPTMRYHQLENTGLAVKFIKSEGLELVGIGPEDIVDGKLKLILGLIWTLILRYQINVIGEGSPKWELLQWVRKQVEPYAVEKPIVNFTTNWQDGTVLSALVDSLKPGVLTPHDLSGLSRDPLRDAEKAMQTATEEYNIQRLIDPEDLVHCPDELAMMAYVSAFRNYLSEEAQRQREELARKKRTADPAFCYATGPGLEAANVYHPAEFTIVAKNCFDEELVAGGDVFDVSIHGPDGSARPAVSDSGNGKYPVTYTVTKPGDYTINIQLRGEHIKNSPAHVSVNGPAAGHSTASGPGVEGARARQDAPFRITAHNAHGHKLNFGGSPYHAQVQGPEEVADPRIHDNHDGTYDSSYHVQTPGYYFVNITLDDEPIQGSPFKVLVEAARAGLSYAEGPGLQGGQENKPGVFTIHAVDPDGHRRTDGGDPFKIDVQGPSDVQPSISDNGDGTYTVNYKPTESGDYVINVTLHDEPIKDAPFHVHIKPAPVAGQSYAEGPALHGLVDNEPGVFTIHAVDKEGNHRTDGGDHFDVDITGPHGKVHPHVHDNGDGTYTVNFDPAEPGGYTIGVSFEGEHIKDSPFSVHCKEGTDADHSGFGIFSFTVQSRDKRGENKTFGGDKFEVNIKGPSDSDVEVQTTDNQDGTYTAVYALAGEKGSVFTIHAALNGKSVGTFKQNM